MFEVLTDRFIKFRRQLLGYGKLTDVEIKEALRQVRMSLLEADVSYKVVGDFIRLAETRLRKTDLVTSLRPGDVITSVLYNVMVELLGTHATVVNLSHAPSIINLVGLQGTGKTTMAGKIGKLMRRHRPLLVACDPKRPAAAEQLESVARRAGCDFFPPRALVVETATSALKQARTAGNTLILFDTAGRLHIDDELMTELKTVEAAVEPNVTLLILDGTAGQDAINQASEFSAKLTITGCCFTKMDADAKGGAVISVRNATGLPIVYLGTGERLDDIELFHPERIASRILGLGDIKTLHDRMQVVFNKQVEQTPSQGFLNGKFDLEDFLTQLKSLRKMGPISALMSLIPGASNVNMDEAELTRIEAMIQSMTQAERHNPDIIDGSRRRRIAAGAGVEVADVNRLLREFCRARELAKRLSGRGLGHYLQSFKRR